MNGSTPDEILDTIRADLDFLIPLLMKWPKCYWIWNYRLWLFQQAKLRLDVSVARRLWQEELGLVGKMLIRDHRNFHAWGYRRMVVAQLESRELHGSSMVEAEFEYTTKMIKADLSNFSAWHYRSKLIPRLLNERQADDAARQQFLDEEFDQMTNALYTVGDDQSVWFYYQFLMGTLMEYVGHPTIVPNFTRTDRVVYVNQQLTNLKEMLDGGEDCKWLYIALLDYTRALWEMDERQPQEEEFQDSMAWLNELRKLDPLRQERWDDLERSLRV